MPHSLISLSGKKGGRGALVLKYHTYSMGLHILRMLGSVHRTDVGVANCCCEMRQIASLSSRATFTNLSFPIAGNKGGRYALVLTIHTAWACIYCVR